MPDLFDYTAERLAYEGGRSLSQERAELMAPKPEGAPTDGLFEIVAGEVRLTVREAQACVRCGAAFVARPRTPAVCNLCRRKANAGA